MTDRNCVRQWVGWRGWDDLNDVKRYAAKVEDAMKARQSKTAIVNAVWLGISAHKAFQARPLEPKVLSGRKQRSGLAQETRTFKKETKYRQLAAEVERRKAEAAERRNKPLSEISNHPIVISVANDLGTARTSQGRERQVYRALEWVRSQKP